jgi:hypothetical protein
VGDVDAPEDAKERPSAPAALATARTVPIQRPSTVARLPNTPTIFELMDRALQKMIPALLLGGGHFAGQDVKGGKQLMGCHGAYIRG